MGVAQYIKVDCEDELNNGFLHACPIPSYESVKNSDIQKRIKKDFEDLDLKIDDIVDDVVPLHGNTIKEILSNMEQKLTAIEEQSKLIQLVEFASTLIEKTEKKLEELKASPKKVIPKYETHVEQQTTEEVLAEAKRNLTDIYNQLDKIIRTPIKKKRKQDNGDLIKQVLELRNREYSEKRHMMEIPMEIPEKGNLQSSLLDIRSMSLEVDELLEAEHLMAHCDSIVYFEAWVVKKQLPKVKEGIEKITKGKCVIEEEEPKFEDKVPTIIKRTPLLFEGFEILTYSLGFPRNGEINPTYLMAITFPFLFGIMFADVGHGAILFFGGIFLLITRGRTDMNKVGEIPRYFLLAAGIITLCGISSMAWGYLFGEFFGPSGVLHPVLLLNIGPFYFGGFDPAHEPLKLIRFAILIGVSFISFCLIFRLINHLKRREWAQTFAAFCWIWFILGGFYMWVYWGGISQITSWFGEGLPMLLTLVVAPLIIAMIVVAKAERFMEGVNFSVEMFIETLGNTLSFCRLAALFLAHTALSTMFLDLGGVENGIFPLSSILILVPGTVLILVIEGLIVMVHCVRLHWVELFPKFYSAEGSLFHPIKIEKKIKK